MLITANDGSGIAEIMAQDNKEFFQLCAHNDRTVLLKTQAVLFRCEMGFIRLVISTRARQSEHSYKLPVGIRRF